MRNVPLSFRSVRWCVALWLSVAATTHATPPVVAGVEMRGLQIGQTGTLTFTGTDLLPNPRLLTTARLARQTLKEGAKPNRIVLEVELAPGVQPGFENWWLVTDHGVSARGLLAVDPLAQQPFAEKIAALPVALHGTLNASQVREVTFTGRAGQEIICEIEAQRLESKVRPVLKLYGPGNVLLHLALPMAALRGDTRLEAKLPADGEYRLQFHDLQYAATGTGHFCLKIGQWSYADVAFPSTVQRGVTTEIELVGHAGESQKIRVSPNTDAPAVPAPWPDPSTASGPQAVVRLSDSPELVEERTGTAPQALGALPVAVNGRIGAPGELDSYELTVEPETEIALEVTADALGSPIDAELELRDSKGARLAVNDDTPLGPDPSLTYKVPKDVTKLIAVVRDVNGNSGPRCIYRLAARTKKAASAGFSLTMVEDSHTIEPGRPSVLKVEAARSGYDGPIDLAFDHLPEGVKVSGQTLPAQATAALLTFASEQDGPSTITEIKGRGKEGEALAHFDSPLLGQFQPWLANDLALTAAVKSEIAFSAGWGAVADGKKVPLSGKLTVPITCSRPPGHDGPVRLTLLTSQARRFLKAVVDPATNLREEKAVLIEEDKGAQTAFNAIAAAETALAAAQKAAAANKDEATAEAVAKKVDDAQAAVDAAKKSAADASQKAKNETDFTIVVPVELPEIPHQFAFKAELLKRDRTTVEAVTYTSVREFPVVNPIALTLAELAPVALNPKTGATAEFTGQVDRLEGATGDVTVTLAGLPAGVAAPAPIIVKAGASDFKFALKLPPAFKPGEYPDLKISASGKPYGTLVVKTRETAFTLKVVPAEAATGPSPPPQ